MLSGEPPIGVLEPLPETVPATIRAAVQAALSQRKEKRPRDAAALLAMLEAPPPKEEAPLEVEPVPTPAVQSRTPPPRRVQLLTSPFRSRRGRRPTAEQRGLTKVGKNASGLEVLQNSVGMHLVRIPPGEFRMGDDEGDPDQRPAHRVMLSRAFLLGEAPVTQAEYEAVMGTCSCRFRGPLLPVENVSWGGAMLFLRFLGRREGVSYRLPTEAEWEYACRAGSLTRWPWGDDPKLADGYAWVADNSNGSTHGVREKRPNAWGLYDMIGNTSEWCADWYHEREYERSPTTPIDPAGPATGAKRVIRGGTWNTLIQGLGSPTRGMEMPSSINGYTGFRVAMTCP